MALLFRNHRDIRRDFDRLFGLAAEAPRWKPNFDIANTEGAYVLTGDIPGVAQKDLEVRVEDGVLRVRGERGRAASGGQLHRKERYEGAFERRFRLPEDVQEDAIKASYKRGVLTLELPRQEPVDTSRLIPVN